MDCVRKYMELLEAFDSAGHVAKPDAFKASHVEVRHIDVSPALKPSEAYA